MKFHKTSMRLLITLCVLVLSFRCFAQEKVTRLGMHENVVTLLDDAELTASSIQSYVKDWNGNDLTKMQDLYLDLQRAHMNVVSRYKVIIEHYKRARRENMVMDTELQNLEKANNAYVSYFKEHVKDHPNKPGVTLWGEIIKIVFETGKQVYDFVTGINKTTKDSYLKDIKDRKIPNWGAAEQPKINSSKSEQTAPKDSGSTKKNQRN